jgi:hypothetical protein
MEFAGVHFDGVDNKFKCSMKMPDGSIVRDQFDIVLVNDNAVAVVEVKYSAKDSYPRKMVEQKVPNFRTLFPRYAGYKIYLGLGSMSFSDEVVREAKKLGVGLLKQVGEAIEYQTDWVRAY